MRARAVFVLLLPAFACAAGSLMTSGGLNLTGCYAFDSNAGQSVTPDCGMAAMPQKWNGDVLYLAHRADGTLQGCLRQICYRPVVGNVSVGTTGAAFVTLTTPRLRGNCTELPRFQNYGLVDELLYIVPKGWPGNFSKPAGTRTSGPHDLSGVFINDGPGGGSASAGYASGAGISGVAGLLVLNPDVPADRCASMRDLPDCAAVPPAADQAAASSEGDTDDGYAYTAAAAVEPEAAAAESGPATEDQAAGSKAAVVRDERKVASGNVGATATATATAAAATAPSATNLTGCYTFSGSAGHPTAESCGLYKIQHPNGAAYLTHRADGSVDMCLDQFCYRALSGTYTTSPYGVGALKVTTLLGHGNCSHGKFPGAGLFAHLHFVVPRGWPVSGRKSAGTETSGADTLTGVFVNNGHMPSGTVGYLTMQPNDGTACRRMRDLPFCTAFP